MPFLTKHIAYYLSEIAEIYPITPSSPMAENCDELIIVTNNVFEDGINYDSVTKAYMKALGKIGVGADAHDGDRQTEYRGDERLADTGGDSHRIVHADIERIEGSNHAGDGAEETQYRSKADRDAQIAEAGGEFLSGFLRLNGDEFLGTIHLRGRLHHLRREVAHDALAGDGFQSLDIPLHDHVSYLFTVVMTLVIGLIVHEPLC